MSDVQQKIGEMVRNNKVILFMKGNKLMPMCGFSATVVDILRRMEIPFETVDVLEDMDIREGIKRYSNWPTIPQLYIDGQFVGGCDITRELYSSGELKKLVDAAIKQ